MARLGVQLTFSYRLIESKSTLINRRFFHVAVNHIIAMSDAQLNIELWPHKISYFPSLTPHYPYGKHCLIKIYHHIYFIRINIASVTTGLSIISNKEINTIHNFGDKDAYIDGTSNYDLDGLQHLQGDAYYLIPKVIKMIDKL